MKIEQLVFTLAGNTSSEKVLDEMRRIMRARNEKAAHDEKELPFVSLICPVLSTPESDMPRHIRGRGGLTIALVDCHIGRRHFRPIVSASRLARNLPSWTLSATYIVLIGEHANLRCCAEQILAWVARKPSSLRATPLPWGPARRVRIGRTPRVRHPRQRLHELSNWAPLF